MLNIAQTREENTNELSKLSSYKEKRDELCFVAVDAKRNVKGALNGSPSRSKRKRIDLLLSQSWDPIEKTRKWVEEMREKTHFLNCESYFYDNFKKVHAEANVTEDNREKSLEIQKLTRLRLMANT